MEKELAYNLISVGRAYASALGLMESTVAKKFAGDGRFFSNLQRGLSFTMRKYDTVMLRFSSNWPEGTDWPEGVQRPDAVPATPVEQEPAA